MREIGPKNGGDHDGAQIRGASSSPKSNVIIRVATDFWRFRATLDALGRRQLPYAASLALNQAARTARDDVTRALPAIFSAKGAAPTPFTMNAIGTTVARKSNLRVEIFVKRQQARYLAIEETGGVRVRAPGSPVLAPVDVERNVYGNIPRGLLRKLLEEPDTYFLARIRGVYGLWQRVAGPGRQSQHVLRSARGLRLLVAFRERAVYHPRFGFSERVRASVEASFGPALEAGMAKAIATAIRR